MSTSKVDQIIWQIAYRNHTTVQQVRKEMELAMQEGLSNPDPAIQAEWARIPRKGETPTLEEFLVYLSGKVTGH